MAIAVSQKRAKDGTCINRIFYTFLIIIFTILRLQYGKDQKILCEIMQVCIKLHNLRNEPLL